MSAPESRAAEGLPRVVRRADCKAFRIVAQARSPDGPVDLAAVDGPPFDMVTVSGLAFARDFIDPRKSDHASHRERPGQAVFNALLRVDPAFAERVRGTELDPFHHDSRIAGVLARWRDTLTGAETSA